jgi:sugar lactone lactonase YvrE
VGDGLPATQASLQLATGLVRDRSGNIYVSDESGQRIRKISSAGTITTYAGTGIAGFSGDGGPARLAMVDFPLGMTLDPAGEIVFADALNYRVRKIDLSGKISTIAGNGTAGYSGDGGPATSASLNIPWAVTYDTAGNLYISDNGNAVIRKVSTAGIITTYAGNGTIGYCGDGGLATTACFDGPKGMVNDPSGNLYVADQGNHRVRIVNSAGLINTVAGNGESGLSGDGGPATSAKIGNPKNVAIAGGVLYISNAGGSRVRSVRLSNGIITTFIGSTAGYDGGNNPPLSTEMLGPNGIVPLSASSMLVADQANARVRELTGGVVKTVAGGFIGDGKAATSAALISPQGIAFDTTGNLYLAEFGGNSVRKVDTTGKISTIAGTGVSGYSGDGGPAATAQLYLPQAVIADAGNNLFITDQGNNVIRRVDAATQIITTFSIDANFGGGLGFMAFNAAGTLFVADAGACVVWSIDAGGNATAVAGELFNCGYNGDNIQATTALLNGPWGVAVDARGNLYIADSSNNRVRMVNPSGTITTFAGDGSACASSTSACGDGGAATGAQLNFPLSLLVSAGVLYITDEADVKIRSVSGGIINTYAGTGNQGYNGNNLAALSTNLDDPLDIAVNPVNRALYEVDDLQCRVRRIH